MDTVSPAVETLVFYVVGLLGLAITPWCPESVAMMGLP